MSPASLRFGELSLLLVAVFVASNLCYALPINGAISQEEVSRSRIVRALEWKIAEELPSETPKLNKEDQRNRPRVTLQAASEPGQTAPPQPTPSDLSDLTEPATFVHSVQLSSLSNVTSRKRARHDMPCRRYSRNRTLSVKGCIPQLVDVGYCIGLCASREKPGENQTEVDGVYRFKPITKCGCCRATYKTADVPVRCLSGENAGHLTHIKHVRVSVVQGCHCSASKCTEKRS